MRVRQTSDQGVDVIVIKERASACDSLSCYPGQAMMAAAVERGGVRAAFLNPGSGGGVGGPFPAPVLSAPGGAGGTVGMGSNSGGSDGPITVPMNLFATWEIDRSSPSCVPR